MDKIKYAMNHCTQFYFAICFLVGFRFITIMHLIEYQRYPIVIPDRVGVIQGISAISLLFVFGIIYYKILSKENIIRRYFVLVSLGLFILGICMFIPFINHSGLVYY